jgi:drug/metabolite transporter (DMT)-like permease
MQMIGGGALLFVASFAVREDVDLGAVTGASLAGIAYLVVFGSLVAYSAYAWLLQRAPASLVATYAYVNPVVAVALGSLFLGERLTWTMAAGGAAIVAAVVLIVSSQHREARVVALRRSNEEEAATLAA